MPDPLSAEAIARMKAEHFQDPGYEAGCVQCYMLWPCDAALLLAELERVTAPAELAKTWWNGFPTHTSGYTGTTLWGGDAIAYGLLGPSTTEELP